jgi:hypothetical protein
MTHLVLIVRNSYEGVHSGQIAFPGEKWETEDADYSVTACGKHMKRGGNTSQSDGNY